MASRFPLPPAVSPGPTGAGRLPSRLCGSLLIAAGLLLAGCQQRSSAELQRIEQLELKIQQLEQRLIKAESFRSDPADKAGKPPAGPIKSLTYRTTNEGNQLRIYWADNTQTDLECNQEQATLACG